MTTENKRMIQRKGTKAQLPSPTDGEIYIATDTKEMYFGAGGMNKVPTMADIVGSGGGAVNVVDNLNSTSTTHALSANMGKTLNNNLTSMDTKFTQHLDDNGKHVNIDNTVTATKLPSEFAVGLTYSRPVTNSSSTIYTGWRDLLLTKVGLSSTGVPVICVIETFKRATSGLVEQTIKVYDNINGETQYGKILFTASRTGDNNGWQELYVETLDYIGTGSPEGVLRALHGASYFDYTNNKSYTRIPTTLGIGVNGWVLDSSFSGSYNDLTNKPTITSFVLNTLKPEDDISTLENGVYYTHPTANTGVESYVAWRDLIATSLNVTSPGVAMRVMVTTVKNSGRNRQTIDVFSGTTGTRENTHLFSLTRSSLSSNVWSAWTISYVKLYGEGNPQGTVLGVKNMEYIDTLTGDLYVKTTSQVTPTNAGWVKIASNSVISGVSLAQYKTYSSISTPQTIAANTQTNLTYSNNSAVGSDTNTSLSGNNTIKVNTDGVYEIVVAMQTTTDNVNLLSAINVNGGVVSLTHKGVSGLSYTVKVSLKANDLVTVTVNNTSSQSVTLINSVTAQRVG